PALDHGKILNAPRHVDKRRKRIADVTTPGEQEETNKWGRTAAGPAPNHPHLLNSQRESSRAILLPANGRAEDQFRVRPVQVVRNLTVYLLHARHGRSRPSVRRNQIAPSADLSAHDGPVRYPRREDLQITGSRRSLVRTIHAVVLIQNAVLKD